MATGSASGQRPELLSRVDVRDTITGVVAIPHEDAVISTSEDKYIIKVVIQFYGREDIKLLCVVLYV